MPELPINQIVCGDALARRRLADACPLLTGETQ